MARKRTVYCSVCGRKSDRGCIAKCRECSVVYESKFNSCINCRRNIPSDQWCCERCFAVYDGENFHNDLLE